MTTPSMIQLVRPFMCLPSAGRVTATTKTVTRDRRAWVVERVDVRIRGEILRYQDAREVSVCIALSKPPPSPFDLSSVTEDTGWPRQGGRTGGLRGRELTTSCTVSGIKTGEDFRAQAQGLQTRHHCMVERPGLSLRVRPGGSMLDMLGVLMCSRWIVVGLKQVRSPSISKRASVVVPVPCIAGNDSQHNEQVGRKAR